MTVRDPLDGLNPGQRAVALSRRHTLAIACPGSGKTKTLAAKAAYFLSQGERVAACTFTRDSALELRERIVREAAPGSQSRLLVGTFHSIDLLMAFPNRVKSDFGSLILRDMRSPFKDKWAIISEGDRRGLIFRAINAANLNGLSLEDASRIIETAKAERSLSKLEPQQAAMVEQYREMLERLGQIDLQDIILLTNEALSKGEMTPLAVNHLMVDEFQDTDIAGFEWVSTHAKAGIVTTVVADDDQSIYGFRRALGFDGLRKFEQRFSAERIMLDTNYRCRAEILGTAGKVINRNTERIEKSLFASKGPGGIIKWKLYEDSFEEGAACADMAQQAVEAKATFAVISRVNRKLDEIQTELIHRGIAYRRSDGSSIFNLPEVQIYGALLRSIIKPVANDLDKVLAFCGMQEDDLAAIHRKFGDNVFIGSVGDFADVNVSTKGKEIWRSFAKKHAAWVKLNTIGGFSMLNLGVCQWLEEFVKKPYSLNNIKKANALYAPKNQTLAERLKLLADAERMGKRRNKGEAEEDPDEQGIIVDLITAHGCKGLEYDWAWIIGLEEGTFPSKDGSLEEERRLCYVAITRARERLFMSSAVAGKISLFVSESGLNAPPVAQMPGALFA